MESEFFLDKTRNDEEPSREKVLPVTISVMEAKSVEQSNSKVDDGKASLGPVTPDTGRENGEVLVDFKCPPIWVSSSPITIEVAGSDISPRTPKEEIFDPFAPGPDELMLAPRRKKLLGESRDQVSRRLNFDSSFAMEVGKEVDEVDSTESLLQEQKFLETVYESILKAIVLHQVEVLQGPIAETTLPLDTDCVGFRTPESLPLLTGVAETCPGAPVKSSGKSRDIDKGLCRKLEF